MRCQYPLSFKEFFVAELFFCFIFSDDLRPKSINVWKDLFEGANGGTQFSVNYFFFSQISVNYYFFGQFSVNY